MIDFPSSPTNGQVFSNYIFDSSITAWRNVNTDTGIGTLNAMGLKNVVPTSVVVNSGSATTNANGTVTFTGATNVSLNGVFSSTYQNYRIVFNPSTSSANTSIQLRLRKNGTDYTGAQYNFGGAGHRDSGTSAAFVGTGSTTWSLSWINGPAAGDGASGGVVDIFGPYVNTYQKFTSNFRGNDGSSGAGIFVGGSCYSAQTANDGLTLQVATGTFAGTIQVFGYTN